MDQTSISDDEDSRHPDNDMTEGGVVGQFTIFFFLKKNFISEIFVSFFFCDLKFGKKN